MGQAYLCNQNKNLKPYGTVLCHDALELHQRSIEQALGHILLAAVVSICQDGGIQAKNNGQPVDGQQAIMEGEEGLATGLNLVDPAHNVRLLANLLLLLLLLLQVLS